MVDICCIRERGKNTVGCLVFVVVAVDLVVDVSCWELGEKMLLVDLECLLFAVVFVAVDLVVDVCCEEDETNKW